MSSPNHPPPSWFPPDFLSTPAQNPSIQKIDFTKTKDALPEYKDHYALLISNLLTPEECEILIRAAEEPDPNTNIPKWEEALINVGNGKQARVTETRLSSRILWDWPWMAERILDRVRPFIQDDIGTLTDRPIVTGLGPPKRKETWRLSGLNHRLRFLRYHRGEYFRPHMDGCYVAPTEERSFFTLHLYLNGEPGRTTTDVEGMSEEEINALPLRGGATSFFTPVMASWDPRTFSVNPAAGSVLVFQQRNLAHSGDEVLQGTKYTLRSDIMYRKDEIVD
ncbi:hypothetical protein AJ79_00181 [Helicocarpus griseus UAMH5409]|uniref:Prolyl 4-hydroxylase alpha subunit domain-containing protein n=1 Tax=Helicocarpus griseus UAMH5409 TaxID=1447875 RepID=A0A2B7YCY3_9EURO|nr:hypothetical protein AJ79_00181 [Helicocarpus griseus UAMH5409]